MNRAIPFIINEPDGSFSVGAEAVKLLENLEGDELAIVCVAGPWRTGKSFLLNQLLLQQQQQQAGGGNGGDANAGVQDGSLCFKVGGSVNACTKGIWLWGEPILLEDGRKVLLMDTEGLGSVKQSAHGDVNIFALSLLLSSYFIWNNRGVIDGTALEMMAVVISLTQHIHVRSASSSSSSCSQLSSTITKSSSSMCAGNAALADYFPSFLWVVRDFTLQLATDGRKLTDRQYLEMALKPQNGFTDEIQTRNRVRALLSSFFKDRDCTTLVRPCEEEDKLRKLSELSADELRKEFRDGVAGIRQKVFHQCRSKVLNGQSLSGSDIASLAQAYVTAINSGVGPVISDAWTRVVKRQAERTTKAAVDCYRQQFLSRVEALQNESAEGNGTVSQRDLLAAHNSACVTAITVCIEGAWGDAVVEVVTNLPTMLAEEHLPELLKQHWQLSASLCRRQAEEQEAEINELISNAVSEGVDCDGASHTPEDTAFAALRGIRQACESVNSSEVAGWQIWVERLSSRLEQVTNWQREAGKWHRGQLHVLTASLKEQESQLQAAKSAAATSVSAVQEQLTFLASALEGETVRGQNEEEVLQHRCELLEAAKLHWQDMAKSSLEAATALEETVAKQGTVGDEIKLAWMQGITREMPRLETHPQDLYAQEEKEALDNIARHSRAIASANIEVEQIQQRRDTHRTTELARETAWIEAEQLLVLVEKLATAAHVAVNGGTNNLAPELRDELKKLPIQYPQVDEEGNGDADSEAGGDRVLGGPLSSRQSGENGYAAAANAIMIGVDGEQVNANNKGVGGGVCWAVVVLLCVLGWVLFLSSSLAFMPLLPAVLLAGILPAGIMRRHQRQQLQADDGDDGGELGKLKLKSPLLVVPQECELPVICDNVCDCTLALDASWNDSLVPPVVTVEKVRKSPRGWFKRKGRVSKDHKSGDRDDAMTSVSSSSSSSSERCKGLACLFKGRRKKKKPN